MAESPQDTGANQPRDTQRFNPNTVAIMDELDGEPESYEPSGAQVNNSNVVEESVEGPESNEPSGARYILKWMPPILYGVFIVSMAYSWVLMLSDNSDETSARALQDIGVFSLSTGLVFHAMSYIKVECNMSSLPLAWKISAIPAWMFVTIVLIICSELALFQFAPEDFHADPQDYSNQEIFNVIYANFIILFPIAWFYFGFDSRDPKFARFIEDPAHEFEDPWYLSSSAQGDRRLLDTRRDSGKLIFLMLFSLSVAFVPTSTTIFENLLLSLLMFLGIAFTWHFWWVWPVASVLSWISIKNYSRSPPAGQLARQDGVFVLFAGLISRSRINSRPGVIGTPIFPKAKANQLAATLGLKPLGNLKLSTHLLLFLFTGGMGSIVWYFFFRDPTAQHVPWVKPSRFARLDRNCWIAGVKNETGKHIIAVCDTKGEALIAQGAYFQALTGVRYAGPVPSEQGLPVDIIAQVEAETARMEAERLASEKRREQQAAIEAERLEAERLEAERLEAERIEKERSEKERIEAEEIARIERVLDMRGRGASDSTKTEKLHTRIQREIGRGQLIDSGGMANVFVAEQKSTGEKVIWKQATPSRFNPLSEVNRRLRDESAILELLNHPRIPRKVDEGEVNNESGQDVGVLVMEFFDGPSLKRQMGTITSRGMDLTLSQVIRIVLEICEALEYMADIDPPIYHRDIKPANIVAHPDRGSVLIDFGLSKGVSAGEDVSMSRGASEGWSPPERRDGISGPFTDVFSLGQILWHLLTGERPFHAIGDDEKGVLAEKGHPEWLIDLLRMSNLPYKKRIQTTVEFRMRLENEGEMP